MVFTLHQFPFCFLSRNQLVFSLRCIGSHSLFCVLFPGFSTYDWCGLPPRYPQRHLSPPPLTSRHYGNPAALTGHVPRAPRQAAFTPSQIGCPYLPQPYVPYSPQSQPDQLALMSLETVISNTNCPMLAQCCASVVDDGPSLNQHICL